MTSKNQMNRIVSVNIDLLTKARDAFKQIMVDENVPALQNRINEVESAMKKGTMVSVDYGKLIEWRNILGCWGYTDIEKDFNFRFQYFL